MTVSETYKLEQENKRLQNIVQKLSEYHKNMLPCGTKYDLYKILEQT